MLAQQRVEVDQVAQPVLPLALVEQMRRAVQHQIDRRRDAEARVAGQRPGASQDQVRTGLDARRLGQDVVVQVEHGLALDVRHRRQLVHPLAVVALLVRVVGAAVPAAQHQGGFGRGELLARDQQVDVGEQPPRARGQARSGIGRALEQHDRPAGLGQRGRELGQLPMHGAFLLRRHGVGGVQMALHRQRDRRLDAGAARECGQAAEQAGRMRLRHEGVPVGEIESGHRGGLGQRTHQSVPGRAHWRCGVRRGAGFEPRTGGRGHATRLSKVRSAWSSWEYSKSQQSQASTRVAVDSKPWRPSRL